MFSGIGENMNLDEGNDNYSWLDEILFKFFCKVDPNVVFNGQKITHKTKSQIQSQIEIEKLRARIEECQLWIDDFEQDFVNYNEEPKGSLVLKPTSVDRYIALDSIKEEIARLTEKLKELEDSHAEYRGKSNEV